MTGPTPALPVLCACCSTPGERAALDEINAGLARLRDERVRTELATAIARLLAASSPVQPGGQP